MTTWFPPGYEPLADVFERTGKMMFGAEWNSAMPTSKRLRTSPKEPGVGAQSAEVFKHLRDKFCLGELEAFILDPKFGDQKLEPHWWYDDGQASGAFLYGTVARPKGIPKVDGGTIDYGYELQAPKQNCPIGVRIVAERQSRTARAEIDTEPWLNAALSGRAFLRKADYREAAQAKFPHLSKNGFGRIWDRVAARPEHSWIRKPGPK